VRAERRAVIVESTTVPVTVPAFDLKCRGQLQRMLLPAPGPETVAARRRVTINLPALCAFLQQRAYSLVGLNQVPRQICKDTTSDVHRALSPALALFAYARICARANIINAVNRLPKWASGGDNC